MIIITVFKVWSLWGPQDQSYFYNNANLPFFAVLTFIPRMGKTASVLAQTKAVAPNITSSHWTTHVMYSQFLKNVSFEMSLMKQ